MMEQTFQIQFIAAFISTVAFAILFGVPKKYYLMCGIIGALGWLLYVALLRLQLTATESSFFTTLLIILLSRFAAAYMECPVTVFSTTGIIPMVPGGGIYWTAYYIVMGEREAALASGIGALKAVFAIVLGMILVFALPGKWFFAARPRRKKPVS